MGMVTNERMKALRKERGWSQAMLARVAGLNQNSVNAIETGRLVPYPGQKAKIAGALGVPEEELW